MKELNYKSEYAKLLSPEIVSYLVQIHEQKGQQNLFIEAKKDVLSKLLVIAKIQSTEASNLIEGITTSKERLKMLVMNKTTPKGRDENEIAGYRDVLNTIHESYDFINLSPGTILQFHRDLCKFGSSNSGGHFKNADNVISEFLPGGQEVVRFEPVRAWETPEAMDKLCDAFNKAINNSEIDPLILIPMFILDFLCIHPFNDGNGRMSRLLTLLLLYRSGYIVGKYISIEKLIASSKENYYDALQDSSRGWHKGRNNYMPFVRYMLGVVIAAYRDFASRVEILASSDLSKPDKVREIMKTTTKKITKVEIMKQLPNVSQVTVERALKEMIIKKEIIKIGGGRYTYYIWNTEE
jgi:Fic family protein